VQAVTAKGRSKFIIVAGNISINDSALPSVCYTVIYMVRVGLGLV